MKNIRLVRTSQARLERFAGLRPPKIEKESEVPPNDPTVVIDAAVEYQTVEGFGGAFTESAAVTWMKLSPEKRDEVIQAYFSTDNGNCYNLCRTHMNSCDFSLGNYACCDTPGDVELKTFSIDRERQAIVPMIRAARQCAGNNEMRLFISPWSPPAWMKDTKDMNRGGKLLPEYRETWAEYYCRFIQELEKEDIPVWGLTVQNEPMAMPSWDSCQYSAEEERDFVRDHLGPALRRNGMAELKLMVWDHNRYRLYDRVRTIYKDPEAAKYIWGAAFHWYCDEQFDNVLRTHEAFPDKKLLFSEGCHEGGAYLGEWVMGERYAHNMINDLNRHTVGWVDWNLMLDDQGGPNHVGNFCSAPIMIDPANDRYMLQSSYYYIGHFSRYIARGAKRILCVTTRDAIEAAAFVNPDGGRVAVLLNRGNEKFNCQFKEGDMAAAVELPAHSIVTVLAD
ncbi:MAG: glycoside hydrolase family 30 protein [Victivallaceae bacterium]|nr:glycoside hydrolase family 30 protein [Victivallaceae bacterium]